ncbi:MAG: OmpA family protein [Bacteroides sp.]|nr:OmpA family protein [Bacteroides sp.]MCM1413256.1 OmpA family protein [Bacteroides sp.]MCM1471434.1 OmpA family protein [Bacteroides sp.]
MKKFIIAAFALFASASLAQAGAESDYTVTQDSTWSMFDGGKRVITNTFWHNWFIQAGAGAQIGFTEHDRQASIGDRISPALQISVGKWFTPGIGVRLTYNGLSVKGITQNWPNEQNGTHISGPWPGHDGWPFYLYKQKFNYLNFHFDVMFNLCQMIGGYNPERLYSCIPYAGIGIAHVTGTPKNTELAFNCGILNSFRVAKHWDINLEIMSMITDERFSGESGHRHFDALLGATVGATYKFGTVGWDVPTASQTVVVDNERINALRGQIADLEAENDALRNRQPEVKVDRVADLIAAGNVIFFTIDTWQITDKSRANLSFLADAIKNTTGVYTVTGYADKGTGTPEWNEQLSKRRAEAAYNCLINEFGVPADRLELHYKGGVDDMFYNDPRCSRCVIVIPKE